MANAKKIPERQCIACGLMREKKDLIKLVKTPEGTLELDITGKKSGRGAYICRDGSCMEKAFEKKALNRSFKMSITADTYDRLSEELKNIES
ncbi:MAG: YlxR family protein [Clostridiales bacterium]|nr:YlxR family protein [Clostridiales bacterium]MBS5877730.1 YlxR family protein [Clostridiales bacterium]MDU0939639.1 YlxR family protein [Clostridiales bacterium]MDU1042562.1 YlxR family protein [Clostridiales bacterium]MDU3490318.1 YlxR family protein [Clostridiales bacterium]